MKNKITFLFLLIVTLSLAQEKDSIKLKQIEFAEKLTYHFSSLIFNKQENNSKIDADYQLPWNTKLYTESESKTALDTLIKNATFKIKKGSFSNHVLEFNSYFPEFVDEELMDIFKISIKKNNLDNKGTNLDIQKSGNSGFGFHSSSGYENGNTYSHHWRSLNTTFNIKTAIKTEEYSGSVLFESGFVKGYDYLKITNSDVGKEMKIGNYEFTVIDIINNSVILDFKTNIEDLGFTLVNLNKKGQRITSSGVMIFSSQTLFKDVYLKFKENPGLSFEDYKKAFHSKYIEIIKNGKKKKETQENIFGKEYKVFSLSGNLINVYLYMPKYFSKTFEIKYNENEKERVPIEPKRSPLDKKIKLHFENEDGVAVLLGDNLKLLNMNLKPIKSVKSGTYVKVHGKSLRYFNGDKYDETCEAYKYVKIVYENEEYLISGKNAYKIEKLDIQVPKGSTLEFFKAKSNDYLKVLKPDAGMEFCYQITYSPILIKNTKKDYYTFIDVIKNDLYSKITNQFKDADFFQSGSNANIYDEITKIEIDDNGYLLGLRHDGASYKILLTKKNNKYISKYIE